VLARHSPVRFSDYNRLWHYHWISLVDLDLPVGWMRLEPIVCAAIAYVWLTYLIR
jgi:hypothetical protein